MPIRNDLNSVGGLYKDLRKLKNSQKFGLQQVTYDEQGGIKTETVAAQSLKNAESFGEVVKGPLLAIWEDGNTHGYVWLNEGGLTEQQQDEAITYLQQRAGEGITYELASIEDVPELEHIRASLSQFLSMKNRDSLIREYFALQETTHRMVDPMGMHLRQEFKPLWQAHSMDVIPSLMRSHKEAMKEIAKSTGVSVHQIEAAITLRIILAAIENAKFAEKRQEEKIEKAKEKERTEIERGEKRVESRNEDTKHQEVKLDTVKQEIQKLLRGMSTIEIVKDKVHIRFRESDEGQPSLEDLVFSITPTLTNRPSPAA